MFDLLFSVDAWIALADPTTFAIEPWIDEWNETFSGIPCIGGLGSGGSRGDDIFVLHNRELIEGAVAIGWPFGSINRQNCWASLSANTLAIAPVVGVISVSVLLV